MNIPGANRIRNLIGSERAIDAVARELKYAVQELRARAVGAHLVTCSDESEQEVSKVFQQWFAQDLLPPLRYTDKALFRTANLGGRYEWGGVRLAEQHFATEFSADSYKVMVLKINSHAAEFRDGSHYRFGEFKRYGSASPCCGALFYLLRDHAEPWAKEMYETFESEGLDRIAMLNDSTLVDPDHRALFAAICSARLQARRAMLDIQDYAPRTPTLYLIFPCVTLNRRGVDGEMLCGAYVADHRAADTVEQYQGLGDDPSKLTLSEERGVLRVTDPGMEDVREARDHREMILKEFKEEQVLQPTPHHDNLKKAVQHASQRTRGDVSTAKLALKALLPVLISAAPVPGAVMLFAGGAMAIHHVYRMRRIANDVSKDDEARALLNEVAHRIEELPAERAREVVELLAHEFG
ncbi:MAG: hypothetical protein AMXMBFR84_19200 [Candidatus Hydrogenedentota bacterium]